MAKTKVFHQRRATWLLFLWLLVVCRVIGAVRIDSDKKNPTKEAEAHFRFPFKRTLQQQQQQYSSFQSPPDSASTFVAAAVYHAPTQSIHVTGTTWGGTAWQSLWESTENATIACFYATWSLLGDDDSVTMSSHIVGNAQASHACHNLAVLDDRVLLVGHAHPPAQSVLSQ